MTIPVVASTNSTTTVLPLAPILNSPGSWTPLSLSSEKIVDPILRYSTVISSGSWSSPPAVSPVFPSPAVSSGVASSPGVLSTSSPSSAVISASLISVVPVKVASMVSVISVHTVAPAGMLAIVATYSPFTRV